MLVDISAAAAGVLVNAITATGRLLLAPISSSLRDRRLAGDVTVARWLDTYQMTKQTPVLPDFPPALNERLAEVLRGNESQTILQELLAARLTDASEADVTRIRSVWDLTLATSGVASVAEALFDYYDEMICDLVDEMAGPRQASRRELITFVKDRPGHDRRYAMNAGKIERELGWEPKETFETGIRKTVRWYLENEAWVENVTSGSYRQWVETHYSV